MPKQSRARRHRSATLGLLVLVAAAIVAGWWLFAPPKTHRTRVAVTQPEASSPTETSPPQTPSSENSPTLPPAPTASPTPHVSPSSEATSPSVAPSGSPSLAPHAVGSGARLALIVDDCGQWIDTERGFLALGIPLTVSVLPDVRYTATIAREAADAGKGVMLHLPMDTVSGLNPGPGKVTTEMSDVQIVAQVENDLAQVPLARGVNNHEGSKGSADPRVMRDVIGVLAKRGDLFFIDSRTSSASVGEQTAQAEDVPTAARDVFLDNRATVAYTEQQLREAAEIAQRTGSAIAIGHPRPTTLEAVRAMIPQLQADGVTFVLAGDLVSSRAR